MATPPRAVWLAGASVLALAVTVVAVVTTATARRSGPPFPDYVDPSWRQPGSIEVSFDVTTPDGRDAARHITVRVDVGDAGALTGFHTAEYSAGTVVTTLTWPVEGSMETRTAPECTPVLEPYPGRSDAWAALADAIGPIDRSTADGWTVAGDTATRQDPLTGAMERMSLGPLASRVITTTAEGATIPLSVRSNVQLTRWSGTGEPMRPGCGAG